MATSIRNMSVLLNNITERALSRTAQWVEQGRLDDNLRKAEMYISHAEKVNDLLLSVQKYQQPSDTSLNDTLRRIVKETKDFDKFLEDL